SSTLSWVRICFYGAPRWVFPVYFAAEMKTGGCLVFLGLLGVCLGIGGTFGTVTDTEADLSGTKSVQMLYVGYPLKLTCNLTSHENTSFKLDWFKDEMKIESNARTKIFQENSSLLIPSPVKEDVGLYKCQTQRGIPNDKPLNMFFNVIYFEMRKMDKSVNVDMEKSIKLECPVEGQPYPVITWKKRRHAHR
ncbi:hypothetical protein OTU49_003063, partial [Cherax quadricarinatus]